MSTQSKAAYIQWVRVNHPKLYADTMARVSGNLGALSDTIAKVFDTISKTVVSVGGAYVTGKAALDLAKANVKRAKEGLMPVDSLEEAQYGAGYGSGAFGMPPWVLYAGIGLIAFMILKR